MVHERKSPRFIGSSRLLRHCAIGVLIVACHAPLAFAQGGQTEVMKTKRGNPPAAAPAPAAPAPAPAAAPAQKPVSPIGAGAAWKATPQKAAPAPAPAPVPASTAALPGASGSLSDSDLKIVEKVNGYFNNMTNLQGDFIQTDPDSKQRRGRFYFQRPGKARFDYAPPSALRVISDGRNLIIEDRNLNSSERYPLDMTPFKLLLSENVDLATDAHVVSVEQGPDAYILTVEEKGSPGSGRIRLFMNKADTSLKEWIVTDAQGLDTRIEVSNLDTEKKIAGNLFIISAFGFDQ